MNFVYSDLAGECEARDGEGIRLQRSKIGECEILRVRIDNERAAQKLGKPQGRYVTVDCGSICDLDERGMERVRCTLAVEIREMAQRMCGKRILHGFSVLVVGLGNGELTPDAIGPQTVRKIAVTRHLKNADHTLFSTLGVCEIAAIAPGVLGQTGMDAAELVSGAVQATGAELVIAIDALAARSPLRLAGTVQLSDSGIQPGGGIGNPRRALTLESIGVPVLAVGVPTVINCATLVADMLGAEKGSLPSNVAEGSLRQIASLFVTPKEIDLIVESSAQLLARSIEKAFKIE